MQGLYFITDSNFSRNGVINDVQIALECGVKYIQYREKNLCHNKMYENALKIVSLCNEYNANCIINDRIAVAREAKAHGIHIGQDDMPIDNARKLCPEVSMIGISTHSISQAIAAEKKGADYIGFGPVFSTSTKKIKIPPLGLTKLKDVINRVNIPVVAIGGIKISNLPEISNCSCKSAVLISDLIGHEDLKERILFCNKRLKGEISCE
ncbi:MAG: thiamine phosphate synthase [Verrucomicrobiota bacterium]|nr:thiamine phosphate synthase [Verrucomicrobiota bacterium]